MAANRAASLEDEYGSLPVPVQHRTWSPWLATAVCLSFAIGSWSFVVGGYTAYYLPARPGTAALLAGALIGQFLVTLSQLRVNSRYGLETVVTTKPQFGVRGSYIGLLIQYVCVVGWGAVLIIFFGRACASVLQVLGLIDEPQRGPVAVAASVIGVLLVGVLVLFGSSALRRVGPLAAAVVTVVGIWMAVELFSAHSLDEIAQQPALAPLDGGQLTNYTVVVEMMAVSTLTWWSSMGAVFRLVRNAGRAIVPSMLGLGAGWAVFGLISLYSALTIGEADPTIWMASIAGTSGAVATLVLVAIANLGSVLTLAYVGALGWGQIPGIGSRLGWTAKAALVLVPLMFVVALVPGPFYDHIATYIGFVGLLIAPVIGIQIADWFVLGRVNKLRLSSLYRHDSRSIYWFTHGFNPAGLAGVIAGGLVYILLINPVTLIPNSDLFQYTTATIPSALVGGVVYLAVTKLALPYRDVPEQDPPRHVEVQGDRQGI